MSLKIAIGGKGGVGKTTLTGLLARAMAKKERRVIAIDADPVSNLAAALGIPEDEPITPISEMYDLIAERTGAKPGTSGGFFTINPKVDDIPDRFSLERDGVKLLVLGTVQQGGSGCICPESTVLKALMQNLVLYRKEVVLMDMEAGVEHLGRATTRSVDALLIVVNPGARSRVAAEKIRRLGEDLKIKRILILGNRVRGEEDMKLLKEALPDYEFLGFFDETEAILNADREGVRPFDDADKLPEGIEAIVDKLLALEEG